MMVSLETSKIHILRIKATRERNKNNIISNKSNITYNNKEYGIFISYTNPHNIKQHNKN